MDELYVYMFKIRKIKFFVKHCNDVTIPPHESDENIIYRKKLAIRIKHCLQLYDYQNFISVFQNTEGLFRVIRCRENHFSSIRSVNFFLLL